jgi:hypothetical protein
MTGKELLEQLQAMTPEQLEALVLARYDHPETGDEQIICDTRLEVTAVTAWEAMHSPAVYGVPPHSQVPAIVIY